MSKLNFEAKYWFRSRSRNLTGYHVGNHQWPDIGEKCATSRLSMIRNCLYTLTSMAQRFAIKAPEVRACISIHLFIFIIECVC